MKGLPAKSATIELRSVLVATDFTAASEMALRRGIALARHYGASLFIVHVVSCVAFTLAGPFALEFATEAAGRDMQELLDRLTASGAIEGVTVTSTVLSGQSDEELQRFAHDINADLMITGNDERRGLAEVILGSISQSLGRVCTCPILVVGPHAGGPRLEIPIHAVHH